MYAPILDLVLLGAYGAYGTTAFTGGTEHNGKAETPPAAILAGAAVWMGVHAASAYTGFKHVARCREFRAVLTYRLTAANLAAPAQGASAQ